MNYSDKLFFLGMFAYMFSVLGKTKNETIIWRVAFFFMATLYILDTVL